MVLRQQPLSWPDPALIDTFQLLPSSTWQHLGSRAAIGPGAGSVRNARRARASVTQQSGRERAWKERSWIQSATPRSATPGHTQANEVKQGKRCRLKKDLGSGFWFYLERWRRKKSNFKSPFRARRSSSTVLVSTSLWTCSALPVVIAPLPFKGFQSMRGTPDSSGVSVPAWKPYSDNVTLHSKRNWLFGPWNKAITSLGSWHV